MIEIPYQQLSQEALNGIIEAFILREGTDYGAVEVEFSRKVSQIMRQLESRKILIVYDPESEGCNILSSEEYASLKPRQGDD